MAALTSFPLAPTSAIFSLCRFSSPNEMWSRTSSLRSS